MNLKWKLLLPFLFLSLAGTTVLVFIGLNSQQSMIKAEERKELDHLYKLFLAEIEQKQNQSLSMAAVIAKEGRVQSLLAAQDREALMELLLPKYKLLNERFGIKQLHFHVPPGKSFLRVHMPDTFGEMMAYRSTVTDSMRSASPVAGLEWGLSGLGIRGVVPIYHEDRLVGTVEVGFPFGKPFLEDLKRSWGPDFTVLQRMAQDRYTLLATTAEEAQPFTLHPEYGQIGNYQPAVLISPSPAPGHSFTVGPIRDYSGSIVGKVEIRLDRSTIKDRLSRARKLMVLVGIGGICASFFLVWVVVSLFIRPIKEIVGEAQGIAEGRRESRLAQRADDEIGLLARSLNTMLDSLKERQLQIEEYARTLEKKVEERTADLVSSEEKYRTLVDNLPLIVYRILGDGTVEFVNPYFTEKLGYSVEEAVADKNFWREKICGREGGAEDEVLDVCWRDGEEAQVERVVRDKTGQLHTFIDRAIPLKDEQGRVRWIDGMMLDITELKRLQERAIRTEEIRVVGEISGRLAHEIRNPLATAGGFARRLRNSMEIGDPRRKEADIVVDEVAKLEGILKVILSSVQPFTLCISDLDLNQLLEGCLKELAESLQRKAVKVERVFEAPVLKVTGDEGLLARAFENILRHAILYIPPGETVHLLTQKKGEYVVVAIRHRAPGLSGEDLDQFFMPRLTGRGQPNIQDLPLSKVIIHRHGGKIDLFREPADVLVLKIELPVRAMAAK